MNCISIPLNYILHKYLGFKTVCLLVLQLLPPTPSTPLHWEKPGALALLGPVEEGWKREERGERRERRERWCMCHKRKFNTETL